MVRSKDITYGNIGLLSRHGLCRVGNIFATEDTYGINVQIGSCKCYHEVGIVSNLDTPFYDMIWRVR